MLAEGFGQELYQKPPGAKSRVSSFENLNGMPGQGAKTNKGAKGNAFELIREGEVKTLLDVSGQGIIQRIWVTIDQNPVKLRSLRLQMFWDGSAKPAVDVPLGDFFCYNLGKKIAFQSAFFSTAEGRSFNCYIPMPFQKAARIILINEGADPVKLFFDIDFVFKKIKKDDLYFHAFWTRKKPEKPGDDFLVLPRIFGTGRFLGMSVGMNRDPQYRKTWWGEGEVKMYIDDDKEFPTIVGTGAEDYIGSAWGLGTFQELYQGCTVANDAAGQFAFYRWHVPDAVYFDKAIKVALQEIGGGSKESVRAIYKDGAQMIPITIDTAGGFVRLFEMKDPPAITDDNFPDGWVNFYRLDDYAAVSYFYLDKPFSNLLPLANVDVRTRGLN